MNLIELYRFQSSILSDAAMQVIEGITPAEIESAIDAELVKRGLKKISAEKTLFSIEPRYAAPPNQAAHCIILNKPCQVEDNIRLAMVYLDNMPGVCRKIEESFYMVGIVPLAVLDLDRKRLDALRWEMDKRAKEGLRVQRTKK